MAETKIFTCDICKQSKSKDDLAKITVSADGIRMKNVGYGGIKIDICPDCLRKKGFVVEIKKEQEEVVLAQNTKNLEDKIFDILDYMGVAFVE